MEFSIAAAAELTTMGTKNPIVIVLSLSNNERWEKSLHLHTVDGVRWKRSAYEYTIHLGGHCWNDTENRGRERRVQGSLIQFTACLPKNPEWRRLRPWRMPFITIICPIWPQWSSVVIEFRGSPVWDQQSNVRVIHLAMLQQGNITYIWSMYSRIQGMVW